MLEMLQKQVYTPDTNLRVSRYGRSTPTPSPCSPGHLLHVFLHGLLLFELHFFRGLLRLVGLEAVPVSFGVITDAR